MPFSIKFIRFFVAIDAISRIELLIVVREGEI